MDAGRVTPDAAADAGIVADSGSQRPDASADAGPQDAAPVDAGLVDNEVLVTVTLDGAPAANTVVVQGGGNRTWRTDAQGQVVVQVDGQIQGEKVLLASHPEARITGEIIPPQPGLLTIDLIRFDASDNPDYFFSDPGEPTRRGNTGQCGHCHQTINDEWFASPHSQAAKNPRLHDLYAGAAAAYPTEAVCTDAAGRWAEGPAAGGGRAFRCYLGDGVRPSLDTLCAEAPCEGPATQPAQCADCHAPGLDGQIGGRDLQDAEGLAYDYGVHCDVCHRTEAVTEDDPNPGVAGRLALMRPSESASPGLGAGGFRPLTFGPSHDSPNPRMGSVQRDHFREARFCAGCHQLDAPVMVPGVSIDQTRWPTGLLPIHSTFQEWKTGALADVAPCQSCHMPPAPERSNAADLQRYPDVDIGYQGGWVRAPGAVRQHSWFGPRQPESRMLELAAALSISKSVGGGTLTTEVTVKNVSAGHAIPTGEPMRQMVLRVAAFCGTATLTATGGQVVPDFGGAQGIKDSSEDQTRWVGAQIGDRLRVMGRLRGYLDYQGFGPFGDGTFNAAQKGMPLEEFVGEVGIVAVAADGIVTLDGPLPTGTHTYLIRDPQDHAGAPGFAFARVLESADGQRMVPHFMASDVVSDNRLMPQAGFTTTHLFSAPCADPIVHASLYYRAYPTGLAQERGWPNPSILMTEARR